MTYRLAGLRGVGALRAQLAESLVDSLGSLVKRMANQAVRNSTQRYFRSLKILSTLGSSTCPLF